MFNDSMSEPPRAKEVKQPKIDIEQHFNSNKTTDSQNNDRLELYLKCLKLERFENYDSWLKLGFIIFNEKGTCELYDKYSELSHNYDNTCYTKWETFHNNSNKRVYINSWQKKTILIFTSLCCKVTLKDY